MSYKEELPSAPWEFTSPTTTAIINSCDRVSQIPPELYADDEPLPVINRAYGLPRFSSRSAPTLKRPNPTSAFSNEELSADLDASAPSSLVELHTQTLHQQRSEPKWHQEYAPSVPEPTATQEPEKATLRSRIRSIKDRIVSRVSNALPRFRKQDRTDTLPSYLRRAKYHAGRNEREQERNSIPSFESGPVETRTLVKRASGEGEGVRFWSTRVLLGKEGGGKRHSCPPVLKQRPQSCCSSIELEWEVESTGRYWG